MELRRAIIKVVIIQPLHLVFLAPQSQQLRLLKLDEAGIINALAIATAKAGGIRGNFGTMTEQIHCGTAAESGVAAAEMALSGIKGAPAIFERKNGWFGATAGGFIPEAICDKLGKPWAIVDPGNFHQTLAKRGPHAPGYGAYVEAFVGK